MKNFIAVLIVISSAALGVYVGFWEMFVGGIIGLIEALKSSDISGYSVAINISKIVFASFVGSIIFYIGLAVSAVISGKKMRKFSVRKFK